MHRPMTRPTRSAPTTAQGTARPRPTLPQTLAAWQCQLPVPFHPADRRILQMAYGDVTDEVAFAATVRWLSDLDDATWMAVLNRWDAIRCYHVHLLLRLPILVSDAVERLLWVHRLAQPQIPLALLAAHARRQMRRLDCGDLADTGLPQQDGAYRPTITPVG